MISRQEYRNYAIILSALQAHPDLIKILSKENLEALVGAGFYIPKSGRVTPDGEKFIKKFLVFSEKSISRRVTPEEAARLIDARAEDEVVDLTQPGKNPRDKRPPKFWWDKMYRAIAKAMPDYSDRQIRATIGSIWYHRLSQAKKSEIRSRIHKNPLKVLKEYRGWRIVELRSEARLGYFKSGKAGKVIRPKKSIGIVPAVDKMQDETYLGLYDQIHGYSVKNVTEAKSLIDQFMDHPSVKKNPSLNHKAVENLAKEFGGKIGFVEADSLEVEFKDLKKADQFLKSVKHYTFVKEFGVLREKDTVSVIIAFNKDPSYAKNPHLGTVFKKHGLYGVKSKDPKDNREVWYSFHPKYQRLVRYLSGKPVPFEIDENDDAHLTFEKGIA